MKNKINPNWITGFVDAEGCFFVSLVENKRGWRIYPGFQINIRDKNLLCKLIKVRYILTNN